MRIKYINRQEIARQWTVIAMKLTQLYRHVKMVEGCEFYYILLMSCLGSWPKMLPVRRQWCFCCWCCCCCCWWWWCRCYYNLLNNNTFRSRTINRIQITHALLQAYYVPALYGSSYKLWIHGVFNNRSAQRQCPLRWWLNHRTRYGN